jgi:hypothetical protein
LPNDGSASLNFSYVSEAVCPFNTLICKNLEKASRSIRAVTVFFDELIAVLLIDEMGRRKHRSARII